MRLRNVLILSVCQALGFTGVPMVLLVGGIIGTELAPSPAWATLPISIMVAGVAVFTIPAALLMKQVGRKLGFILSAMLVSIAALGGVYAIASESFLLLCTVMVLIGGNTAFIQQYRFAAAESVERHDVGKAVSLVLLGGVVAGYLGPEIGRFAKDWLPYGAYSGSFLGLAVLYAIAALFLLFLKDVTFQEEVATGLERPVRVVIAQPKYLVALWSSVTAYGVMAFIMTAAPISMHVIDGHTLDETKWVIQSHVIAMFLPSLFTGFMVDRLGVIRLQLVGITSMFTSIALALPGHDFVHYLAALVLLGIGWNFLFVGGTVLLTQSYRPKERFKAQAVNEFSVFGVQAVGTLMAGTVIYRASWELLNLLNLPLLLLTFILVVSLRKRISPQAAEDTVEATPTKLA